MSAKSEGWRQEKETNKDLVILTSGNLTYPGTLSFSGPGDTLTITGDLAIAGNLPKPTLRQRLRHGLRNLADRTLVPLGLMHYSGCWCKKCRYHFWERWGGVDEEED